MRPTLSSIQKKSTIKHKRWAKPLILVTKAKAPLSADPTLKVHDPGCLFIFWISGHTIKATTCTKGPLLPNKQ